MRKETEIRKLQRYIRKVNEFIFIRRKRVKDIKHHQSDYQVSESSSGGKRKNPTTQHRKVIRDDFYKTYMIPDEERMVCSGRIEGLLKLPNDDRKRTIQTQLRG